uniref:TPR_REGION domain-containing protein n=1 Tax=Rhabditophanes sp. KR3021 TaxID=114890 RepID=A0AC35TX86_9BILA
MSGVKGVQDLEAKIRLLHRVTQITPSDPFAWHALGLTLYNNKSYPDAYSFFMKAHEIKPDFSAANLFYIGDCLRRSGRIEESKVYLGKAAILKTHNKIDEKGCALARKLLQSGSCGATSTPAFKATKTETLPTNDKQ